MTLRTPSIARMLKAFIAALALPIAASAPFAALAQVSGPPLYQRSTAESRAITGENPTGERGQGGLAREGYGAAAARALGPGWKIRPAVPIPAGKTTVLADIDGPAIIRHLWMTPSIAAPNAWRSLIIRIYWDGEANASVEVPMGDFFAMGLRPPVLINSAAVAVNPWTGFNSYWQMPFRHHARITVENLGAGPANLYYQVDYSREPVAADALYFRAQFRQDMRTGDQPYTILDGVSGTGVYVGTYMTLHVRHPGWWGEGEVKFYLDGERIPTIVGTGTEDYFGGAWNFAQQNGEGYQPYSALYSGLPHAIEAKAPGDTGRFGMYRWHIPDPIRFSTGLKVTIQMLGWKVPEPAGGPQYDLLHERVSTVAYWYGEGPHAAYPPLPPLAQMEDQ